jgi:hypothetical protein
MPAVNLPATCCRSADAALLLLLLLLCIAAAGSKLLLLLMCCRAAQAGMWLPAPVLCMLLLCLQVVASTRLRHQLRIQPDRGSVLL